jgi:hypothetical protein
MERSLTILINPSWLFLPTEATRLMKFFWGSPWRFAVILINLAAVSFFKPSTTLVKFVFLFPLRVVERIA